MKLHKASHLDNNFYVISDAAAGALVRTIGRKLPAAGWEKLVRFSVGEREYQGWLKRTETRWTTKPGMANTRGWRWALAGIVPIDAGSVSVVTERWPVALGDCFAFEACGFDRVAGKSA